jgi:hypothetical protein
MLFLKRAIFIFFIVFRKRIRCFHELLRENSLSTVLAG